MSFHRVCATVIAGSLALAGLGLATPAQAWWARGGYGWYGPGVVVVPPPVVMVAPPPVYYAPPPLAYGQACYAGPYVCPLQAPGPVGAGCSCPINCGRAGGVVR